MGVEVVLFDGIRELPHFNPDLESNGELPVVAAWRRALRASAAVLIASPEYGFSFLCSGTLKNAIDWVIGTGEPWRAKLSPSLPRFLVPTEVDVGSARCATRSTP